MNRKKLRDLLRSKYPNNPWFKKQMAKMRIKRNLSSLPMLKESEIQRAEADYALKERIVSENIKRLQKKKISRYRKFSDRITKTIETLGITGNQSQTDSLQNDVWFCWFAYGFLPEEYFCYELQNKNYEERKGFISEIDKSKYVFQMNDIVDIQILNDKVKTYEHFKKYYRRDAICIKDHSDYDMFRSFVGKHPAFVKKNVYESVGRSVSLVDLSSCNEQEIKETFDRIIRDGKHILEERVIQGSATAAFHKNSVNTVRCITFNTKQGIADQYYFMKIGRGGSFIDNGGAGGILVGINRETGCLNTDGFDEFDRRYARHPNTGIDFIGYQLPAWQELRELCCEISAQLPTVRYIGWDLAYTDDGWVIIEGNGMSQMIGPQTVFKKGFKQEVSTLMGRMDLIV